MINLQDMKQLRRQRSENKLIPCYIIQLDKIMQGLLRYGKSLRQFKNPTNQTVFTEAHTYPSFFDKHLVHPSRKIKALINDPNANIRAFYFQYLMLCYEIENQNYQLYINKLKQLICDPNFSFLFLQEDNQDIYNDKQFKRFILQFMEILDAGQFQSTQVALNAFPIADIVLVYFFRSLAIYAQITTNFDSYIDKTVIFGFLLQNFNIDAQIFEDKCIKFIEAEVFVYEQSPQQIYLVYKQIEVSLSDENSRPQILPSHDNKIQLIPKNSKQEKKQNDQQLSVPANEQDPMEASSEDNSGFRKNKMSPIQTLRPLQQHKSVVSMEEERASNHALSHEEVAQQEQPQKTSNKNITQHSKIENKDKKDKKSKLVLSQQLVNDQKIEREEQKYSNLNKKEKSSRKSITTEEKAEIKKQYYSPYQDRPQFFGNSNLMGKDEGQTQHDSNKNYKYSQITEKDGQSAYQQKQKILQCAYDTQSKLTNRQEPSVITPITKSPQPVVAPAIKQNQDIPNRYFDKNKLTNEYQTKTHTSIPQRYSNNSKYQPYLQQTKPSNNYIKKYEKVAVDLTPIQSKSREPTISNCSVAQKPIINNEPTCYVTHFQTQFKAEEINYIYESPKQPSPLYNPKSYNHEKINSRLQTKSSQRVSQHEIFSNGYKSPAHHQFRNQSKQIKQSILQGLISKLNITKQFTDSIILAKMGQPYHSNIKQIKNRSRQYRQSIVNLLDVK